MSLNNTFVVQGLGCRVLLGLWFAPPFAKARLSYSGPQKLVLIIEACIETTGLVGFLVACTGKPPNPDLGDLGFKVTKVLQDILQRGRWAFHDKLANAWNNTNPLLQGYLETLSTKLYDFGGP